MTPLCEFCLFRLTVMLVKALKAHIKVQSIQHVFVQMSAPDTGNSDQLLCLLYGMQPEIEACSYILFSEPLSKGTACHLLSSREKT